MPAPHGGIAAALALLAHDRAEIRPVFQLLLYPMLDDRTTTRTDLDTFKVRVWTPKSNRYGWSSYLGDAVAGPDVSPYAAAARREDLTGLPPAWIGVGTLDLFHDEDVEHARLPVTAASPATSTSSPALSTASTWYSPRPRSRGSSGAGEARALKGAL